MPYWHIISCFDLTQMPETRNGAWRQLLRACLGQEGRKFVKYIYVPELTHMHCRWICLYGPCLKLMYLSQTREVFSDRLISQQYKAAPLLAPLDCDGQLLQVRPAAGAHFRMLANIVYERTTPSNLGLDPTPGTEGCQR